MTNETPVSMRLIGHQKHFRLTPSAHRELLSYLADARDELADDPDGDETVRDLEVSIGDQLSALGDNPVDAGQMRSTLNQVGPVVSEPGKPDPRESRIRYRPGAAYLTASGSRGSVSEFRPQPKRTSRGYERSTSPSRLWEERSSRRSANT